MLTVEIVFLAIAFISLPNLFYRAEFNVPLLLFAAVCWQKHIASSAYLLVISWAIELYRVVTLLAYDDPHLDPQRKPLLLISTLLAFVLKVLIKSLRSSSSFILSLNRSSSEMLSNPLESLLI